MPYRIISSDTCGWVIAESITTKQKRGQKTFYNVIWDDGTFTTVEIGQQNNIQLIRKFRGSRFENGELRFRRKIKDVGRAGSFTVAITGLKKYGIKKFSCEIIENEVEFVVRILDLPSAYKY
ncbi:MAG: hypothetical protein ACXAD7_02320 [Candidatus Kariarchaeaceae archaeon]